MKHSAQLCFCLERNAPETRTTQERHALHNRPSLLLKHDSIHFNRGVMISHRGAIKAFHMFQIKIHKLICSEARISIVVVMKMLQTIVDTIS